jgi:hypothetical protein
MSKHPDPDHQPAPGLDDLRRNPGIGQSPGLDRRTGLEEIEGENTVEGDVENDAEATGAVDPGRRPRDHP